jgi:signal transduction histidine kinase
VLEYGRAASPSQGPRLPVGAVVAVLAAALVIPPAVLGADLPALDPDAAGTSLTFGLSVLPLVPLLLWGARRGLDQSRATGDVLLFWTSWMLLLLALSRMSLALHPVAAPDQLHVADLIRGLAFVLLAVGCVKANREYWQAVSLAAVEQTREGLAIDLHDGVAQDLALISSQSRWLAGHPEDRDGVALVASAAQRALEETRASISALRRDPAEPLDVTISRAARSAASRMGCAVTVEVEPQLETEAVDVETLLRDVRTGVMKLAGDGARHVRVKLSAEDGAPVVHLEADPLAGSPSGNGAAGDPHRRRPERFGV